MGVLDKRQKVYFSDPDRFADAWNALMFHGEEILHGTELTEGATVLTHADRGKGTERITDLMMKKTADGRLLAILLLENQGKPDYGMVVRILVEEALAYEKQVGEIRRHNEKLDRSTRGQGEDGEFLYRFFKKDRLRPVATLVLYWNDQEWDGANTLEELIDFEGAEELREYVPKFRIHLVDMSKVEDTGVFRTDLKSLVEYFQRRNDKERFREYCVSCEEKYELDENGMFVLSELVKSKELKELKKKGKDGDNRMCKAITELIEDGRREGISQGISRGISQGISQGEEMQLIMLVQKKIKKGKPLRDIMDELEADETKTTLYYDRIIALGQNCTPEEVWKSLQKVQH